jgi:hypothetical protein
MFGSEFRSCGVLTDDIKQLTCEYLECRTHYGLAARCI